MWRWMLSMFAFAPDEDISSFIIEVTGHQDRILTKTKQIKCEEKKVSEDMIEGNEVCAGEQRNREEQYPRHL